MVGLVGAIINKVIICGTKNDLRFDDEAVQRLKAAGVSPVTEQQGEAVRGTDGRGGLRARARTRALL